MTLQQRISKLMYFGYLPDLKIILNTLALGAGTEGSNGSSFLPFNTTVTFSSFPLVMAQKQINAPLTITCSAVEALPGASVLLRLVADGVQANTPVFSNAQQITGSSGWDNRVGIINIVQMQFDGTSFYFSIVQTALGAVLDLQAPTLVSSAINAAGTIATLTFNEDLLTTSLPTGANFTGLTVTSTSILNKVVTLNISPAVAVGTTNIAYSGTIIKDLAGNSSAGFTTPITVAPASVITPANLDSREAGMTQVSVGTYKKIGGGWQGAISSTLNFVGDKTYETSDVSLSSTQGIIGLDTRTLAGPTLQYQNGKYWFGYYSGSFQAATNGAQSGALTGYATGDLMRMKRTGSTLVAQTKRGTDAWTTRFTWSGVTEPLSTLMFLDDNNSQLSVVTY